MDLFWKTGQTLIFSEWGISKGRHDVCLGGCCLCLVRGDFDYSKSISGKGSTSLPMKKEKIDILRVFFTFLSKTNNQRTKIRSTSPCFRRLPYIFCE